MRWLAVFTLWVAATAPGPALAQRCDEWQAVFELVEGTVEIKDRATGAWRAASQGSGLCYGDSARADGFGRALLRLPDNTLIRLDSHTSLTFPEPEADGGTVLDLLRGVIHIISRDPRSLRFNTPYANAGLEGTEFVLAVTDSATEVTVVEGEVSFGNDAGQIGVVGGQRAIAGPARPPSTAVTDPFAAIDWARYHARIVDADLPAPGAEPAFRERNDAEYYARRAASRLGVGAVTAAAADLDHALELDPDNATALAQASLLALRDGDRAGARELAERAAADGRAATPLLALSYLQQAEFELTAALASVEAAVELEPDNALAWARLAESRLALGSVAEAGRAAERAVQLAPDLAEAQTVRGFALLRQARTADAIAAFRRAETLDRASPLTQLGLGVALIRHGELEQGRQAIEIAVSMDPQDALLRSYMGKTYSAEYRQSLTDTQLLLARTLDPEDPTPLLYEALSKQSGNRPVEALQALHSAYDLNGNRAVFRSRLTIDDDLASRSAGLGQLHTDLRFEQLALLEGWKATTNDPANFSAHRMLADVYASLPRHQNARVNEFYQAQLLQPVSLMPIRPQLAESNLFVLDRAGPSQLAGNEFVAPVDGNGIAFQGSGVAAGHATDGADVAVAGRFDRASFSLGHFGFASDGFRINNDFDQQVSNVFVQLHPSDAASYQLELRSSTIDKGDLRLLFDPNDFSTLLRQSEASDSARFGVRRNVSEHSILLASAIVEDARTGATIGPGLASSWESEGFSADIQHLYSRGRLRLSSGVRLLERDEEQFSRITVPIPVPPFQTDITDMRNYELRHASAYTYATIDAGENFSVVAGLNAESVSNRAIERDGYNAKLGLIWNAGPRTTVRAAAFRTLQGPFFSKYDIQPRLEPTHVAGFNQLFFGSAGERAARAGVGIDHRLSDRLYAGVELSGRALETPVTIVLPNLTQTTQFVDVDETLHRAYLYWTPGAKTSVSAEYLYERIDNHGQVLQDGHALLRNHRLPIAVNWFPSQHLRAGFEASYIDQRGDFAAAAFGPAMTQAGEDRFWVLDASMSYRLPKRHGAVSLLLYNALDEAFQFQDTDPENPRIIPDRMLLLRFTLSY